MCDRGDENFDVNMTGYVFGHPSLYGISISHLHDLFHKITFLAMHWHTKLTQSFPCRFPVVGAPMAGVAGGQMAAQVCRAGGLGFVAGGFLQNLESLEKEIDLFRAIAPHEAPLCVGFIGHGALASDDGWKRYQEVLERHKP